MYCPNCEAEYEAGITVCRDCNMALVERLTPETMVHDRSEATVVPLASFKLPGEAQMLQELLDKNNIRSFVQGATDTIATPSGFSEVTVFVDERDLAAAEVIHQEFFEAEVELPAEGEPGETVADPDAP